MTWIDDDALRHLRATIDRPDLSGSRYELLDTIGRGGMGTVYRARDTELDRDVALKVLALPDTDGSLARRLRAEATILARLEHPGIVPVHDAGQLPDGRAFYVMKYVRGRRLDQLDTSALTISEIVRTARRVCDPVAFAHAHRIIHRDLKPQNVMIGDFGEVLVLDWGVARVSDSHDVEATDAHNADDATDGRTAAGATLGTPGYMPPEQQAGGSAHADERADVYGIAGILFFLLIGGPPGLDGAGGRSRIAAAGTGTASAGDFSDDDSSDDDSSGDDSSSDDARVRSALERRRPPIPRRLRAIVARGLSADAARRYPSVRRLADDLDRFLDGEPISAHRENILERTATLLAKHRTAVALVVTYMVLRIVFILVRGR